MSTFIKKNSYTILFLVVAWLLAFAYIQLITDSTTDQYKTITISSGDTLWEIALEHQQEAGYSIPDFIAWVEEQNQITGRDIRPGDQIIIPIENVVNDPQYFASSGE
ncbi:MAG TPA: LysM peptidoglycan-binding domain-containing protein [Bacillus sp. (in: firmicutes)]|nr:LysM peptidoglycan-binding domain-containing protein [Bacillus sp. (in: firmicutes)]